MLVFGGVAISVYDCSNMSILTSIQRLGRCFFFPSNWIRGSFVRCNVFRALVEQALLLMRAGKTLGFCGFFQCNVDPGLINPYSDY